MDVRSGESQFCRKQDIYVIVLYTILIMIKEKYHNLNLKRKKTAVIGVYCDKTLQNQCVTVMSGYADKLIVIDIVKVLII